MLRIIFPRWFAFGRNYATLYHMTIVWILIAIVVVALLAGGLYFTRALIRPKTISSEDSYRIEVENGRIDEEKFASYKKQEVTIVSPFGYPLYGLYFPCEGAQKTVILLHGIIYTLYGMVKFLEVFRQRGFNVLMIDHRHHGRSGGPNITYGYYEKHDLAAWFEWAQEKIGPNGRIGTLGESMGAAIVLQHAALEPRLAFVIADCPFSDLHRLLILRLREDYRLPAFPILPVASWITRLISGMEISAVSPVRAVAEFETPLLLTHGLLDGYIPAAMTEELYAAKTKGIRKLHLVPGAKHVESFLVDPRTYEHQIDAFLSELAG